MKDSMRTHTYVEHALREQGRKERATYHGACNSCGDEWTERTPPAICPECHSLDVRTVKP